MLRESTSDVMLALIVLMEKYKESQKELHCGSRERLVQCMYEDSETVVKKPTLSPFLFTVGMDR